MGWLIALCIMVAISFLPLGVSFRYDAGGFRFGWLAGLITIPVSSNKEKKEKTKKTKKKSKSGEAPSSPSGQGKAKKKGGALSDFIPFVELVLDFLQAFRRKLRVRRLDVKLIMASDDPCDLAVNYGRTWAALNALIPQLERCFVIKKRNVEVECDFEATEPVVTARIELTMTVGRLLHLLLCYGLRALKHYLNQKKSKKAVIPNE